MPARNGDPSEIAEDQFECDVVFVHGGTYLGYWRTGALAIVAPFFISVILSWKARTQEVGASPLFYWCMESDYEARRSGLENSANCRACGG
jgi:hypothetical protein